jgi:UDP-glucose 4-epimerase
MYSDLAEVENHLTNLRIAVTGHRGFLGRHLVAVLGSLQAQVWLLDGDVQSPEAWTEDFDLLFHLAAVMPNRFNETPETAFAVNLNGTLKALGACREREARLVFASTCGVYSPSRAGQVSETSPVAPPTPYAQSKLMAETLCRSYADHYGVSTTILRLFNVYGEGQKPGFLIPYLLQCAVEEQKAVVYHPDSSRDFVHVSDVVRAMIRTVLVESPWAIFNIGSGSTFTVRDLLEIIGQVLGKPVLWEKKKGVPDSHPRIYAQIKRADEDLDWQPLIALRQGIKGLVDAKE